jgi:hypothetical protein
LGSRYETDPEITWVFLAEAAVDGDHLPGNKLRRGEEEEHRVSDVVGRARAAGGSLRDQVSAALIRLAERNHAGGDRVHGNLRRESLGQSMDWDPATKSIPK